jgi:pentatricopeptide repeat protein
MHACILCDEHEEALQLYDQYVTAQDALLASDWQWAGGESNRLNPLCRDLAMRAMGGVVSGSSSSNKTTTTDGENHVGVSTQALECYWSAMEENVTVSIEALCGVAEACRNDGRWEDAMSVFFSVLTKSFHHRWLVPGSLLSITPVDAENGFHPDVLPSLGPFVGSVLNACNDAGHFATGAIAVSLLQCSLSSIPSAVEPVTNARDLSEMFLPVFEVLHQNSDSLLAASIKSLVQLGCTNESLQLFEAVNEQQVDPATLPESRRLFDSIRQKRTTAMSTTWPLTLAKAHHFITCFQSFVDNEDTVTEKEAKLMASALASLVSAFTAASQSQAGITLATWVDLHTSSNNPYLPMTDALAGSLIDAHSRRKNYKAAVELFSLVPADANHETRLLTYTATIKSLFRLSRASEAVALFETIVKYNRSPDLMSAVASGLLRAGDWSAALDVYRLALAKGCLSEEVGLLAIKSVSVGRVDGRSRIMRNIIDEVSGLSGMSPNDWIELKYWDLKRLIGFGETARLMWWSDFQTRSLFELNFALASQEKRMLDGLTPKNDALRLIASAAKSYQEYHVPEGAVELSYVPRSVSDWKRALTAILAESQHSSLFNSRAFIESVAIGFVELGSFEEATKVIDDAVDRGLDVDRSVLYTARQTATGS